jgi:PAS domain-containing protein
MQPPVENGVHLAVRPHLREKQSIEAIRLEGVDLLDILAQFDPYGVWRMDLDTAVIRFTGDCARILGIDGGDGQSGILPLMGALHPDDRKVAALCMENAIENRTGFRFVLRVPQEDGEDKLVKMTGQYRALAGGGADLFGTLSEFQDRVRSAAFCAPCSGDPHPGVGMDRIVR